ncbi:MAG: hypothetical protein ACKO1F_14615 [Flammeovirgaceae bacterium]
MKPKSFLCSWRGGKDSCYALMKAQEQGFAPHFAAQHAQRKWRDKS